MATSTIIITIAATVGLLLVAVVIMGVRALFIRGGRFPSPHAHDNPELSRRGIGCHRDRQ